MTAPHTALDATAAADDRVTDAAAAKPIEQDSIITAVPFTPSASRDHQVPDRFSEVLAGCLNPLEQESIINLALDVLKRRNARGESIGSPKDTRRFLQVRLAEVKNEVFGVVFLDNRHRILAWEMLFTGTVDGASVYPRVVVQRAIALNAAAAVLCHNHPSGIAEPSQADRHITDRLKDALALVDVRLLDHIVVSFEDSVSFAERGLI